MDPARWLLIETLFNDVLAISDAERDSFLDRACVGDAELRREVETLLLQHDQQPSFLDTPILDFAARTAPDDVTPPGTTIGPYTLVRSLGRGGMGEVFLATRTAADIEQTVALKIIRRGMDTDEVLRRFRLERRILANLHHPNIARLLDAAATDDGRPYFVMEHVDGVPLDDYCDQQRLSVPRRLALFQVICGAVHHAHQNLVVHRDLKPKNILVTTDGAPKLLDFGIGKVLATSETFGSAIETESDVRLLTPEYAAPEQVTGGAVTTATDVYALGVMLYELLAGHHPYATGMTTREDVERAVLEANPSRPSEMVTRAETRPRRDGMAGVVTPDTISDRRATDPGHLRRRLAGDLDNIVLMALRKEPSRRYPSAATLADDIQRHLDGRPVRARPDTLGYRTRKFVRRNAGAVAAAAMAFIALGATTAVTFVQSRRVARESARVTRERDKALEVRGFLMEMFGASGADRSVGDTVTARRLLDLQVAQLAHAYGDRPDLKAEMMAVLADGYDRLGLYRDAEPLARDALALRRGTLEPQHPDIATSLNLLGWITHEGGHSREAEPMLLDAAAIRRAAGPGARDDLSWSLNDLGVVYNALNRYADAERVLSEALAIRRALHGDDHRTVGITANNLAAAFYYQSKLDSAVQVQGLALEALRQSVGPDHQRSVIAQGNLAAFNIARGHFDAAETTYRDLLARQTRLQGREHPVTVRVLASLASVIFDRGAREGSDSLLGESERMFRDAIAMQEARLGGAHPQVATTLDRLASVLLARHADRAALNVETRAYGIFRAAQGDSNPATWRSLWRMADMRAQLGDSSDARWLQRQVIAVLSASLGATHPETGRAHGSLCALLTDADPVEAERTCARAETVLRAAPPNYRTALALARLQQAKGHLARGNVARADSVLALVRVALTDLRLSPRDRRLFDSLDAIRAASPRP